MHNEGNEGPVTPEDPEATGESGSAGKSESTTETETATEAETTAETDPVEAAALGDVPIKPFTGGEDINVGDIRYTIISEPENGEPGEVHVGTVDDSNALVDTDITDLVIPGSILYEEENYDVTAIGNSAFSGCSWLESVIISEGVIEIGDSAFRDCGLRGSLAIPGSVETIGSGAFSYCVSLGSVTIPGNVETIGSDAFSHCESLGSVTISEGVKEIGSDAFLNCRSLGSVTIPGSVETIGSGAFYGCPSLTKVTFEGDSPPDSIDDDAFSGIASEGTVSYPDNWSDEDIEKLKEHSPGWKLLPVDSSPVDPPREEPDDRPTRPRPSPDDDRGDDGGGSATVKRPLAPAELWMTAANLRPPSRESLRFGVRVSAWEALTNHYYHDSVRNNAVEVRTYFDDPGLFTADSNVSGWVTGAEVDKTRATFEKWFANRVRTIHFDRVGKWEQPVKVAAKVDLAGWDTTRLAFYYYDPKANLYRRLANPAYWIDANGYLRFQTEYAGEIIIAEGELEKR